MNRRRLRWAVGGLALAALGLAGWITASGMRSDLHVADCIIIPGARAIDALTPGPTLQARIDRAIELYRLGLAPRLLFTGGLGESGVVESEVARGVAMRRGIPQEAILVETRSHDTWENLAYAREVMLSHGLRSCLIVTDPFHSQRCQWIARDLGLIAYPAPTFEGPGWKHWGSWLFYTGRECGSTLKYFWEQLGRRHV